MTRERFAWIVIYFNLPLVIAVGVLAFVFEQWTTVKILLGINIVLLLLSLILHQGWLSRRANNFWKPVDNPLTTPE